MASAPSLQGQSHSIRRCSCPPRSNYPDTCAFLVEPIQGEAGIVIPPEGFLREAANICRQRNVLLMVDEIQSGLGRTGKLFAYMHEAVTPDVLIIGKALAGGFYPVSAVWRLKKFLECTNRATTAARSAEIPWVALSRGLHCVSSSRKRWWNAQPS